MCAQVGYQQSRGVVTAQVRIDMFGAFVINVEISTNRLTPYLSEDQDSSYYHPPQQHNYLPRGTASWTMWLKYHAMYLFHLWKHPACTLYLL
jgi:hypothetical protein